MVRRVVTALFGGAGPEVWVMVVMDVGRRVARSYRCRVEATAVLPLAIGTHTQMVVSCMLGIIGGNPSQCLPAPTPLCLLP